MARLSPRFILINFKKPSIFDIIKIKSDYFRRYTMAKKKRVSLTDNFEEVLKKRDFEAFKAIYEKCELNAYYDGRFGLRTALHHRDINEEFARWLIEQGLDVNVLDYYENTPLCAHATYGDDMVKVYYELGGDINKASKYGTTALHNAADYHHVDTVKFLVDNGADVFAKDDMGRDALHDSLMNSGGIYIIPMLDIAEILLNAGVAITPEMQDSVRKMGEDFEFHRDSFKKENIEEIDSALQKMYKLFAVEPVARRVVHDGVSPIIPCEGTWKKKFNYLWDYLVPSSGPAKTVQGELIRIGGRIGDEFYRNGGINWDSEYRKMADALPGYFTLGTALSDDELAELNTLISEIKAQGTPDAVLDRICELVVTWVAKNPNPIALAEPSYKR